MLLSFLIRPTGYAAGTKHMTLADLAFMSSYTTLAALNLIDLSPYKALPAWLERVKREVPNHDKANGEGVAAFVALIKPKMQELGL